MKVYLSSAISHDPDYVKKFNSAADTLRRLGYNVVNPVEICEGIKDYRECMKIDLIEMLQCDIVCNIKDGFPSVGRDIELMIAYFCGIKVINNKKLSKYKTPESVKEYIRSK